MIDLSHEVFTRWDKEKAYYKPAIMDLKTGDTWPREPNAEETKQEKWLKVTMNPATKTLFKGKEEKISVSEDGIETKTTIDIDPYESIYSIQREKVANGEEYLLSKGFIMGFNQFGEEYPLTYSFLGRYWETKFAFSTELEDSSGQLRRQCKGPQGGKFHYTRPFTPGNVDKLWALRDKTNCMLLVHDVVSGEPKQCKTLEMFKTKDFDFIMNDKFMTEEERKERMIEEQAKQGIAQVPTKGKK